MRVSSLSVCVCVCVCVCAQELQCSFTEISSEESEAVLRKVLLSQQADRYKRAQAFISVQGLQPDAVARLVSTAVLEGLLASAQEGESGETSASFPQGFMLLLDTMTPKTVEGLLIDWFFFFIYIYI